ncbi:MAG TPA: cupin domain-containing protein [Fontimonas sp.]
MQKTYRKYPLNETVTMQMISQTDDMMSARFWFSGKGFDGTHHHPHQEINVVIAGEFEATRGTEKFRVYPGQVVVIPPDVEHNMECLTPGGEMVSVWTPSRRDLVEKFGELEAPLAQH